MLGRLVKSVVAEFKGAADVREDDNNEMATGDNRGQEELSTLERSKLMRACCKIKSLGGTGSGSLCNLNGVLCVMTNNHVLSSKDQARQAKASFCAVENEEDKCSVSLQPDEVFFTDKDLDYTFVAVQDEPKLKSATITPVSLVDDSLKIDDYIYMVQYPRGGGRQDSTASVCDISKCGRYVFYKNDTDYGSSGSPVFKGNRVLALHHQRAPEHKANRGVSMKCILNDVHKKAAQLGTDAEAKRKAAAAEAEAKRKAAAAEAEAKRKAAAAEAEAKRKAAAAEAEAKRKAAAAAAAAATTTVPCSSPTSSSGATVSYSPDTPGAQTASTATSPLSPSSTLDCGLLDSPASEVREMFPILTEALGKLTNRQLREKSNKLHKKSSRNKEELTVALMKTEKQRFTKRDDDDALINKWMDDDDDELINKWIKKVNIVGFKKHMMEANKSAVAKEVRRVLQFG